VSTDDARADWEARVGRRRGGGGAAASLPPPGEVRAESGAGHVTVRWERVEGAIGYLVHRAPSTDGPWSPVDHGGRDVLAMPGPVCCDTTGVVGEPCWYAITSLAAAEAEPGELSEPVAGLSLAETAASLRAVVRADRPAGRLEPVWRMIGSERLSQLLTDETTGGRPIAAEFEEALRLAHEQLGAERVRAHAILHDDLAVYREEDGEPRYDFSRVDEVYDRVLAAGLHPVVEVSFMPRDLAADPAPTIFAYRGHISPPREWERWGELCRRLAEHLVERYGLDEVRRWGFEIWNEANLEVFWAGTQAEYFRLYDVAVRAIRSVDEGLLVGGPSSAAAGWIADFLDFVVAEGSRCDFLTTHTYGNLPLDVREAARVRGLDPEVWWTEWGASPTHFNEVSDLAWGAPYVLHGMKSVQGRAEALAYWVVSDHFEELGRPPRLLHGGFGLLSVGNLRKPRWWALALAQELGTDLVELRLDGDGAGGLVDGWATRAEDGTVSVLLWNGTLNQRQSTGAPRLDRDVEVRVEGLEPSKYAVSLARVERERSNVLQTWSGGADWPSDEEWERLREADRLEEDDLGELPAHGGSLALRLELPMPGVARLRLAPTPPG
jgi:xylan 1,4-beta-xylosidase